MAISGFGEVAECLRRSTVLIQAGGWGAGSGVIWRSDGLIVTNAHVVRSSRPRVELWDGRSFEATVTARDSRRDLAALRISAGGLPAVTPADSSRMRPGEIVIAIGNPLGFVGALTTGVIFGIGPVSGLGPQSWVQATVRLAPGNSGGPLADTQGRVIGINTMVAERLALAVSSAAVAKFLATGFDEAWLGVTVHPVRVPRNGGYAFGLLAVEIEPGSPAANASLLPGDILIGAEDRQFQSLDDLGQLLEVNRESIKEPVLRLEFLRGDYARVRRVAVQLDRRRAAAA